MRLTIFIFLMTWSIQTFGQSYMLLPIVQVYDGDTIKTNISRMPEPLNKYSIRIRNVDTPERGYRAKCEKEAKLAEDAKQFVIDLIGNTDTMKVENFSHDKYGGRIVADVRVNGKNIGEELIKNGYAVHYDGTGAKRNWCE